MSNYVTAVFKNRTTAEKAVDDLIEHGIRKKDISVLMSDSTKGKEFAMDINSKAPEGAAAGALAGGTLGAIAAGLTTVGTVAATTGGLGLLATGPIVGILAGGGAGAATGGIIGSLIGLGFNDTDIKLVDKDIQNGSILITTESAEEWRSDIKEIFERSGAKTVKEH